MDLFVGLSGGGGGFVGDGGIVFLNGDAVALAAFGGDGGLVLSLAGLIEVVRADIAGEPVFVLHVFAVGFKHGERQSQAVAGKFADEFAVAFHDREIVIVHPDHTFEETLFAAESFWLHLENIGVELIELLLAGIFEVVVREFLGSKREERDAGDLADVFEGEVRDFQSGVGLADDADVALAV